jgi:hypothetical protein
MFLHGTFIGQGKYPTFRPAYRIVKWREGAPGDAYTVLRDTVWSTELKMTIVPDVAPVYGATNLARTTGFGATATHLFTHDNAHPEVHIHDASGMPQRLVVFDVADQRVSAADRDSVTERLALLPAPNATWAESARREIMEWRRRFPATRAALHWHGTDREGGAWLGAYPPTTRGAPVFIRVTAQGAVDRCWRSAPGTRPLALARDRVVVVEELDDGDRVWVEATTGFPSTGPAIPQMTSRW